MAREFIVLSDGSIGRVSWTEGCDNGAIYVGRAWHENATYQERNAAETAASGRTGNRVTLWHFAFEADDDSLIIPDEGGEDSYG